MIRLVDISPEIGTWELEVEESQKEYVASVLVILGRAYVFRNYRSRAFWIYHGDGAVGMGLYYDCPERESYDFCQLMIDKHFQLRGYGKAAVQLVLDEMRRDGRYRKVTVNYVDGNDASRALFEQFGFREVAREYDEVVMELTL